MSDSLRPHELQHSRPPCPSPTPGVHPNFCPSSQWCHPAISSSVVPFSSCPQSLPASGSFPMSQLFTWGGQSIGVSTLAETYIPVKYGLLTTSHWMNEWMFACLDKCTTSIVCKFDILRNIGLITINSMSVEWYMSFSILFVNQGPWYYSSRNIEIPFNIFHKILIFVSISSLKQGNIASFFFFTVLRSN